jgi:hypothetical protein
MSNRASRSKLVADMNELEPGIARYAKKSLKTQIQK